MTISKYEHRNFFQDKKFNTFRTFLRTNNTDKQVVSKGRVFGDGAVKPLNS